MNNDNSTENFIPSDLDRLTEEDPFAVTNSILNNEKLARDMNLKNDPRFAEYYE